MTDLLLERPLAVFKTKAETLQILSTLLQKSSVEAIHIFTEASWRGNKNDVIKDIQDKFEGRLIIIRSSALNEDTADCSNAGYFESVLHINSGNAHEIQAGISTVVESYAEKGCSHPDNPILIQSQTIDVVCSGTILNRDYNGSPYYIINYSKENTTSVTSGQHSNSIKILQSVDMEVDAEFANLIHAVREIESHTHANTPLDIEFGIKSNGEVVTFQVRPLVASQSASFSDIEIVERVSELKQAFRRLTGPKPHLAGETTLFGDMPDWNPAEIIGNSPRTLAMSLYDDIITGNVWHQARASQGYTDVNPAKLVIRFGNKPYVDTRSTFNSLTPASISIALRKKLVSFYLEKLRANPQLQDKVEFDILFTCYDLSFKRRSDELKDAGFSDDEIEQLRMAILNLTNSLLTNTTIAEDVKRNEALEKYRQSLRIIQNTTTPQDSIQRAVDLLEACKRDGTLQFSRLARLGFIGKILLKSLVREKVITSTIYDNFLNSIHTVASDLTEDSKLLDSTQSSKVAFLLKYGHLRPGTYDITIPRYDATEEYLDTLTSNGGKKQTAETAFSLTAAQHATISQALEMHGLTITSHMLFDFVRNALESREYSKFLFTKSLSDAIEAIAISGGALGFTRDDLSHLDVQILKESVLKTPSLTKELWSSNILKNKKDYTLNHYIPLPPVIFNEDDMSTVTYYDSHPSYITNKKMTGSLVFLKGKSLVDIKGKVVVIESADPGYDWILTKSPAALITKYGGPASHMAIRCAESGLPAIIGAGEMLYDSLSRTNAVTIDCENEHIELHGEVSR